MEVNQGKVTKVSLIRGNMETVQKYQSKFDSDPSAAVLGELGFGTQILPYSGADIQDEKIFGTFHIATGRNDHLNGSVGIKTFNDLKMQRTMTSSFLRQKHLKLRLNRCV